MDFVLALHSQWASVLNHGRWPHGSDWLCDAALDSYLPLLEQLQEPAAPPHGTRAPVTIGFTPVLANQLASPAFAQELEAFFDQREAVCREAPAGLAATGDGALLPLVDYWKARLSRLRKLFQAVDRDIVAAFRRLQDDGHLEIIGSAATHGYLPLLARDESVQLQLTVGRREHRRLFGRDPVGCWLPECAYRPRAGKRRAIEDHLAAAGFRYFFTDAHLARAGTPLGMYSEIPLGAERFDAERHEAASKPAAGGAKDGGVVVAPFDTELFGHWWFEGVDFLAAVYRELRYHPRIRAATGSQHLADHPPRAALRLAEGSWGVNGDHTMWLNDRTAWTWPRLRALEGAFWKAAPAALASRDARPVLAQAARELLLAQASDWQFMISTGAVPDYAERRFKLHCDDAERLIAALTSGSSGDTGTRGVALAVELERRDGLFPNVLDAVAEVLGD